MTSHTLRLLPGGRGALSDMTEDRLRFIELIATSVEHWIVAGADDLDLACSDSVSYS